MFLSYVVCEHFQVITNPLKILKYIYWKKNLYISGPKLLKSKWFNVFTTIVNTAFS